MSLLGGFATPLSLPSHGQHVTTFRGDRESAGSLHSPRGVQHHSLPSFKEHVA